MRIKKITTMTTDQMGLEMNAQEEEVDEEYDNTCSNMAQAHLMHHATMANMSNGNTKMDAIPPQLNSMQEMFQ